MNSEELPPNLDPKRILYMWICQSTMVPSYLQWNVKRRIYLFFKKSLPILFVLSCSAQQRSSQMSKKKTAGNQVGTVHCPGGQHFQAMRDMILLGSRAVVTSNFGACYKQHKTHPVLSPPHFPLKAHQWSWFWFCCLGPLNFSALGQSPCLPPPS